MWKKLFKLEYLVLVTIFALPVYLVRFAIFGWPLNLLDILQISVVGWWLADRRYPKPNGGAIKKKLGGFLGPISLILAGAILSLAMNNNWLVGAGLLKSWFLLPILFLVVASFVLDSEKKQKQAFSVFFFSATCVALSALIYKILGIVSFDGRLSGIFNSPNYLAMYVASGIVVGSALGSQNLKRYGLLLGGMGVCLYFTFSYASWAALTGALFGIFWYQSAGFSKKVFLVTLIVLVAGLLQINSSKFSAALHFTERSSLVSRQMVWRSAGKIIQDNYFLGIGLGNFQAKYLEYQRFFPPYLEWAVPHPHNVFLAFWLQAGLLGLLGFGWLLFQWLSLFRKAGRNLLLGAALGLMLYFLVHGLVDTTYFKNDLAVIFWLTFLPLLPIKKVPSIRDLDAK